MALSFLSPTQILHFIPKKCATMLDKVIIIFNICYSSINCFKGVTAVDRKFHKRGTVLSIEILIADSYTAFSLYNSRGCKT